MGHMDDRWARLGKALAASRRAQNLTQEDIASRAGLSMATVQGIERGTRVKDVTPSMRVYATAVSWTPDSISAVLEGGKPTLAPAAAAQSATGTSLDGLPYRIAQALADGTALDARLKSIGPGGEIVIILKGREGATDEEMRAILREWERQEGHLDRLGEVADESSDPQ